MSGTVRAWAQWLLPFAAVIILLGGMRAQFLPAVPLTVVLIGVWLYVLPSARAG